MVTLIDVPKNLHKSLKARVLLGAGPTTVYIPVNPRCATGIHVDKNGELVTISFTLDTKKFSGGHLTDLEDPDIIWFEASNDKCNFFAGNENLIAGIKLDLNPISANVNYTVIQDNP